MTDQYHAFPSDGIEVRLLDEQGQCVAPGEAGEIAVRGRYLAAGYWRNAALTAARFSEAPEGGGQYLQLVISASYSLVPRSRQEIIDLCLNELRDVLPAIRGAKLVKGTVVKETSATFSPAPGSDQWRPAQKSPLAGLFLAGDWTFTGWPSTMEGAVRSGTSAARAAIASLRSEPSPSLQEVPS